MISARVVASSVSPEGVELRTIEGTLHRFVLGELAKHRLFSMSAQSTRAVPSTKLIQMVEENPAMPVFWGKNQKGMRADDVVDDPIIAENLWRESASIAAESATALEKIGLHKQLTGRVIEPFMWQKVVLTGVDWENFYQLRLHKDAQPELRAFAEAVVDAIEDRDDRYGPLELTHREWHMPFVTTIERNGVYVYQCGIEETLDLENAKRYSAARCATTSYRTETLSLERGLSIFESLSLSEPKHSVPLEHVARPMLSPRSGLFSDDLSTHIDRDGWQWSGNFRGWGQFRKELTGTTITS